MPVLAPFCLKTPKTLPLKEGGGEGIDELLGRGALSLLTKGPDFAFEALRSSPGSE